MLPIDPDRLATIGEVARHIARDRLRGVGEQIAYSGMFSRKVAGGPKNLKIVRSVH